MLVPLALALALSAASQLPPPDRSLAETLARSGRTVEALDLFEEIVARNPGDAEARLWVARLELRLGRTQEAEAGFRSVLAEHPSDIDAHIGLGAALTRNGNWREALTVLSAVEPAAGENSDLFGALARAYRRAGDDRRALAYYRRAKALSPRDPDLTDGFEAVARTFGHSIAVDGYGDEGASDARFAALIATVRVVPRLWLEGSARAQRRDGSTEAVAGGGAVWRVTPAANLTVRAAGGSGNVSMPNGDLSAAFVAYTGAFETGAGLRYLAFAGAAVSAVSPTLAWDPGGRWRLDLRYSYSRSSFHATGESSGDHSVMLRETWRGWRRVDVNAVYAYGIERFEDLTADRLASLGTTTAAGGLRIRLPSLTSVAAAWEHQWRSNATAIDRFLLGIVQSFP